MNYFVISPERHIKNPAIMIIIITTRASFFDR